MPVEEANKHQEEVDAAAKPDNAPQEIETIDVDILVQPVVVQEKNVPKELVEEEESVETKLTLSTNQCLS